MFRRHNKQEGIYQRNSLILNLTTIQIQILNLSWRGRAGDRRSITLLSFQLPRTDVCYLQPQLF